MIRRLFALLLLVSSSVALAAPVEISHAWARATAPGQNAGAAYMTLTSQSDLTLTAVESPASGSVEIHRMSMRDGVMEMRMLEVLALPAGHVVKLEPGGFHLMLFDLKKPLKTGETVPLTLSFKDKTGKVSTMKVELPIKRSAD